MIRPLLFLLAATSAVFAEQQWTVVECTKISDHVQHSAFTDLLRFQDSFYCVFRESTAHIPGKNGVIRVLRSADARKWETAFVVAEEGVDLRDPKITPGPDGAMMLLAGGSVYPGDESVPNRKRTGAHTRVFFSKDGVTWTKPEPVSLPEGEWLWRVTWHAGIGYGVSYSTNSAAKEFVATLWKTNDGIHYEKIAQLDPPCWPNETTVRLGADDTMYMFVRGEQPDRHAVFGRSSPPYTKWEWTDAGRAAQGPNFLALPDGRMIYAGRDLEGGAKTVVGEIREGKCVPLVTLPSGGDCSYPGLIWLRGELLVSYYSSHEGGKTAIYLARVKPESSLAK